MQSANSECAKHCISIEDASLRNYHYKLDHLLWEQSLKREWELDLQTALVQVRISYFEPAAINDEPEILVSTSAE
jgi:hypothetical protein